MKIGQRVRERTIELIEKGHLYAAMSPQWSDPGGAKSLHDMEGWLASAANILEVVFPSPLSPHRAQASRANLVGGVTHKVGAVAAILEAMLVDIDAGVIATVADAARGEVFDDFLDQAQHYLDGNKVEPAGVVSGVVFEDTVRKLCRKLHLGSAEAKLDLLISELERASIILPVKAKRARVAADVRTRATHANWDKFDKSDVEDTIKITRELIELLA